MSIDTFYALLTTLGGLAVVSFLVLMFVPAPFGRHERSGWGPTMSARAGWVLMELPALVVFAIFAFKNGDAGALTLSNPVVWVSALWILHYTHRTFVFPFRARITGKRMPWFVAGAAFAFNCLNGALNGAWVGQLAEYDADWLSSWPFMVGTAVFFVGFVINVHSDSLLFNLRQPGETGYKIPRGGLFRWVSCPNYLGELTEWAGWALAAWSPAGLVFVAYTAANLIPRALTNHAWYHEQFEDYPEERRAVLPGLL